MMTPTEDTPIDNNNRSSLYEDYQSTSTAPALQTPSPQPAAVANPWGSTDNLPSPPRESSRSSSPVPPERTTTPPPSGTFPVMSAHGNQHGTWAQDWDEVEKKILVTHQKLSISVSSPEIISSMMSKHVCYTVKTEPLGYTVRRRYNDFVWLRETLVGKYNGLFIPALPSTNKFNATQRITGEKLDVNGDFVKGRMHQLHLFTQQLCRIPFIRTEPAFVAFISIQNEKEFKIITESAAPSGTAYPGSTTGTSALEKHAAFADTNWRNDGLEYWNSALDFYVISQVDSNRTITEFKRQLDLIRQALETLEKECRSNGRKALQFVSSTNSLQEQFLNWQKTENDLLDSATNEYINPHGSKVKTLMTNLTLGQLTYTNNIASIPQIIARVILSSIQYQIVQVETFKVHLVLREQYIKEFEKAEKERIKALEEKNKAAAQAAEKAAQPASSNRRLSMFSSNKGVDDWEEICTKKTEVVNYFQRIVDRMTKALIYCEIDRFNQDRLKCINTLIGSLSVTNLEMAQASQKRWSDVVTNVGIDTREFSEFENILQHTLDVDEMFSEV